MKTEEMTVQTLINFLEVYLKFNGNKKLKDFRDIYYKGKIIYKYVGDKE